MWIDDFRLRLPDDLRAARHGGDLAAASAIRSLLTALPNAEAVPVAERPDERVERYRR